MKPTSKVATDNIDNKETKRKEQYFENYERKSKTNMVSRWWKIIEIKETKHDSTFYCLSLFFLTF